MKNIGIVSLNSGGTMGHMSLTTTLANELIKGGFKTFLLSDHDYSKSFKDSKNKISFINLKKVKHNLSSGGNIDYPNKKEIIDYVESNNITNLSPTGDPSKKTSHL